ncbi:LexA family protein [Streptomyces sp. NPDC127061]|uniref:LexA family protein n=1 Tax=Streptomyces sp. NPDC127061 TaxID=3347122 RepID=UPI003651C947
MTRPDALSSRQEAILATIGDWIAETVESPSVRQIGEPIGLSTTSFVAYQLGRLEARGLISRTLGRLPELTMTAGRNAPASHGRPVPSCTWAGPRAGLWDGLLVGQRQCLFQQQTEPSRRLSPRGRGAAINDY